MSIRGITFVDQKVKPQDDGRLYQAIFDDGILYGCAFSSSGFTLTMGAGHIIACGRQIKVSAAQNFPLSGASDGYGRVLLVIDLSKTATETSFDQVYTLIQYSDSISGFPEVTAEDINAAGRIYQLPLAVCSLSSAGITDITKRLGKADFKEAQV